MANTIEIKITANNSQAIQALKQVAQAAQQTASSAKAASQNTGLDNAAKSAVRNFQSVGQEVNRVKSKLNNFDEGDVFSGVKSSGNGFLNTLSKIGISLIGIMEALKMVKEAASKTFGLGLGYDQQMETARMGIAGILVSMTTWNGQQMKLNQALEISQQTLSQIQEQATKVGLVPNDLVSGFQSILGPGLKAKMTLEEIVQLTTMGTKAVKTMLGPQANDIQITQELRSMVSGTIDQNSTVARALGITNADVENAKQSAGGLFAYLKGQLQGFKDLAEEEWPNSMTGTVERFKAMFSQASGNASLTLFDELKGKIQELTAALFVTDEKTKQVSFNPELLSTVKTIVEYTIILSEKIIYAGQVVGPHLVTPLNMIITTLKFVIDNIYGVTTALLTWKIIQKAIDLFGQLNNKIEASRQQLLALRSTATTTSGAIAAGANTAAVAVTKIEAAANLAKIAIRGLASATLWGAIATMAGWAVEKIMNEFDKVDKRKQSKSLDATSTELGNLSAKYEGSDPGTISDPNNGDPGGKSYGVWQLSLNAGTLQSFVDWLVANGWDVGNSLSSVELASSDFDDMWKRAAEYYGESFLNAQRAFIKENFYDVTAGALIDAGLDVSSRSNALKQVVWSTSVQHGPQTAANIIEEASGLAGSDSDSDLIKAIFDVRARRIRNDPYLSEEWKDSIISNRYFGSDGELNTALSMNPDAGRSDTKQGNGGGLGLKNPEQDVEGLARAKVALADAIASNKLQEYIADLKSQEQSLENKYAKTNAGTASPEEMLSAGDYTQQKANFATERTNAEIEYLNQQIAAKESLKSNKNLSLADRTNIDAEISKLQSQIVQKQKDLQTTIDGLNNAQDTALQAIKDEAGEVQASNFELKGRITEATILRQQKQNRALVEKFTANNMTDALKALEENTANALNQSDLSEAQKDLEKINQEIISVESDLLLKVYNGTQTAVETCQEYINIYSAKTKPILDRLNEDLRKAIELGNDDQIQKIREAIQKLKNAFSDFYTKAVKEIDDKAQDLINLINADQGKTQLVKTREIDDIQKKKYRDTAAVQLKEADRLSDMSPHEKSIYDATHQNSADYSAQMLRDAARLNQELGKTTTLLEDVENAGRQGLENGLTNFFEEGYKSCHKLMDAVRDLAITMLTEMNKVFAQDLTRRLMERFFYSSKRPSINGTLVQGPFQEDGIFSNGGLISKFASGGSVDSGIVKGPGTGTSDSILAYLGNFKKFIGISDGEFVVKSAAVKKYGTNFLDNLNKGLIPSGFSNIKEKFASGGSLTGAKVSGVQDVAASLTNNNVTNIPLKIINLNDPNEIGKYLQSRSGEKVMINWIKNNATTVKHILK